MIAFLALNSHKKPSKVLVSEYNENTVTNNDNTISLLTLNLFYSIILYSLLSLIQIIGGGDGGVARECLKHPGVERVVQCEIDARVVELAKEYLPSMSNSYNNPRLELVIEDGLKYVSNLKDSSFDVIITDSSDPDGPAECLFQENYYSIIERKLTADGIICCQAESIWFELDFIRKLIDINKKIFNQVAYASTMTCSYPSGQIGFLLCSKSGEFKLGKPVYLVDEDKLNLRYYNKEIHEAAFVLPSFVRKKLYSCS